jgi:hypothetical protein
MSRLPLIAATALALAVAAPAGAISGWGVSDTLRRQAVPTAATVTKKSQQAKTCQAGKREKSTASLKVVGGAKNPAVVACEQPPRSDLVTPALKSAAAAILSGAG